ncbi:ATP-binding cassette domain-containing protein [Microbacterium stercoris]|uniref:ABC transporter ATP-binding protein n=1 Tax=Microbacterium stercoris TaxID=2820289 RepID=A0A939QHL7_9MICO|nr:ATP-binding cassette domain-containing protein [Microbacterium stercoris]MBO3663079.1 ABC transporter ATP-binding protein [Microbacterium stercoris]
MTADLASGKRYAITGSSGSGKSTLLSILAGQLIPSTGAIENDTELTIGWVFQNPTGSPRRTAIDHVVLPMLARGMRRTEAQLKAMRLLYRFGLMPQARSEFRVLSGGQGQRLMLARAVAHAPGLLLVDEPTAQLDQHSATTVNEALRQTSLDGGIVVIATHDQRTADQCDEQIALTAQGRHASP